MRDGLSGADEDPGLCIGADFLTRGVVLHGNDVYQYEIGEGDPQLVCSLSAKVGGHGTTQICFRTHSPL